jgi:hypothetical protein
MSLTDPHMAAPLCSTLSLNEPLIHCSCPDLKRTMSLPNVKKRLRPFRRDSIKRQKTARDSDTTLQPRVDPTSPSVASPAADYMLSGTAGRRTPSPGRKRDSFQQWLSQYLVGRVNHRVDSVVLTPEDIRKEAKQVSKGIDIEVTDHDGEPVPDHVIDAFFKFNLAGGSAWQESRQWEDHMDNWEEHKMHCFKGDCSYCRKMYREGEPLPTLYRAPSLSSAPTRSALDRDYPKDLKESEDSHSPFQIWRRRSRHRKEKGKEMGTDQDPPDRSLVCPRTQVPDELQPACSRAARVFKDDIVIQDRCQPTKTAQCSMTTKPIDLRLIPVPGTRRSSEASNALDLSDPSQLTGRPYGESPLEPGLLSFPIPKISLPPSTPRLKPEQRLDQIPGPLRLEGFSRASSTGAPFDKRPLAKYNPNATRIVRGAFPETITLVNTSNTTAQSAVNDLLDQYHKKTSATKLKKRRPPHRSPSRSSDPLSTSPGSCTNSDTDQSGVAGIPDLTFGATGTIPPRPRPVRVPTGPADRDPQVCTLANSTGSPLPDCPVYMSRRERNNRWWAGMKERHWNGMCKWRYRCESEDED